MSDAPVPEATTTSTSVAEPESPATDPVETAPAGEAPRAHRRSVSVPAWLLAVLAVAVLVVGAFFIGRHTAPDSHSGPTTLADAVEQSARGDLPVGQFDLATLLQALRQNPNLDLGALGNLLGNGGR